MSSKHRRHHHHRSPTHTSSRNITLTLDECQQRVQEVSELLLISCKPRPVFISPDNLTLTSGNFKCLRDRLFGQLDRMLLLTQEVVTQTQSSQISWKPMCQRMKELSSVIIDIIELSAHIWYLLAVKAGQNHGGLEAELGPVADVYSIHLADMDIRLACHRLKRLKVDDLHPSVLVDLCSSLTKSLTSVTETCRAAADAVDDVITQDQFKLCIKAMSSSVSCLVTSIKAFRQAPSDALLSRLATFCDPVVSTCKALVMFATEEDFIGRPAQLTASALESYKACIGITMSISSAAILIYKTVRDLVYPTPSRLHHHDRLSLCVESLARSSTQIKQKVVQHLDHLPTSPSSTTIKNNSLFLSSSTQENILNDENGAALSSLSVLSHPDGEVQHAETTTEKSISNSGSLHGLPSHSKGKHSDKNLPSSSIGSPPLSNEGHISEPDALVGVDGVMSGLDQTITQDETRSMPACMQPSSSLPHLLPTQQQSSSSLLAPLPLQQSTPSSSLSTSRRNSSEISAALASLAVATQVTFDPQGSPRCLKGRDSTGVRDGEYVTEFLREVGIDAQDSGITETIRL